MAQLNTAKPTDTTSRYRPVIGPRLGKLLTVVFVLFGLLAINSLYLGSVTLAEWAWSDLYQDYTYQLMFLLHLVLGLVILLPAIVFGALHLRNAWPRPNYRAVRAGLALYVTVLVLLFSGLVLTRFGDYTVNDPRLREVAYWLHVVTPLLVVWLFILYRLAGTRVRYRPGLIWAVTGVVLSALLLVPQVLEQRSSQVTERHQSIRHLDKRHGEGADHLFTQAGSRPVT